MKNLKDTLIPLGNKDGKNRKYLLLTVINMMTIILAVILAQSVFVFVFEKKDQISDERSFLVENAKEPASEKTLAEQIEKGYGLPIDVREGKEAEDDCKKMMERIREIYIQADKGDAINVVLSDKVVSEMQNTLKKTNNPIIMTEIYANMENFERVDDFLKKCMEGVGGSAVVYEMHSGGGIGRMKFIYDGTDMYVLRVLAVWDDENEPKITYTSYTRIKEWKYTEKGWFCYELCVPEPPEVTEIVDGSCMLRIKPMTDENREMSEKCVLGLAYQGNNLLCSNWDTENMEDLDYNGLYEYLYAMKYGEKFDSENYPDGIPKKEFESLIMEYLPITGEKIQTYAVFDEQKQTYVWERLCCFNYSPTYFGTSFPEVTHIKENEDGTVVLTVDAVCQMILCNDAVITHELTVRFSEDGSFRYLGNKILNDGVNDIPDYQYRINRQ